MNSRSSRPFNATLITSSILLFAAICLSSISTQYPELGRSGVTFVTWMVSPLQRTISSGKEYISDMYGSYLALRKVKDENRLLKARVERLEMLNIDLIEEREENKRLRFLVQLERAGGIRGLAAHVIAISVSGWTRKVTVNKGTNQGVAAGMAVVEGGGVVGQVLAAATESSEILLMTDHTSSIDVILQNSRARGVVEGRGSETAILRFVSRDDEVRVGDRVITSGLDGVYSKGLLVGTVVRVDRKRRGLFQTIEIKPAANLEVIEAVTIVQSVTTPKLDDTIYPWCDISSAKEH